MVREIREPSGPVDLLAGRAVHLGDGAGTTAEHAHLAHLQQQFQLKQLHQLYSLPQLVDRLT